MKENKNQQTETLNEEQLEEAVGGNKGEEPNCYFEPESPVKHMIEHGRVLVKCKSICCGIWQNKYCKCHDTRNCVNKWHIVEQANPGLADGNWVASPKGERNHGEDRKLIKNLFI